MPSAVFAELLSTACSSSSARLVTPEDPAHSWCAVARPLVLSARVSPVAASVPEGRAAAREGLVPLLPLLFEKLLGRPLDLSPWSVPVIAVVPGESEDGGLDVSVALHAPPPAEEGLFEVATPLGPATLRLGGLTDARAEVQDIASGAEDEDEEDQVLVLSLPPDWLEPSALNAAWDEKTVEIGEETQDEEPAPGSLAAWRAWLSQWGELTGLKLSAHAGSSTSGGEAEPSAALAATFASAAACRRCAAALGGGRLLVLQDPPRAIFASAQRMRLAEFEERSGQAWREHMLFKQEISRIDRALVFAEAREAVPMGGEGCFRPLLELLERWLASGTLHATSTVCAQRRLQEADASARGKAPELFRKACWHSAFRVVLQIRSLQDTAETLALALSEHWRKTHGICLDTDADELAELLEAVQEVWDLSGRAEDEQRRCAEAEAESAERALLEELEAEESGKARDRKKREKKHQKERQRRKEKGSAKEEKPEKASQEREDAGTEAEGGKGEAAEVASLATSAAEQLSPREVAAAEEASEEGEVRNLASGLLAVLYRGVAASAPARSSGGKKSERKRTSGQRAAAAAAAAAREQRRADSPPARRPADIEAILEAVRKSEELRPQKAAPAVAPPPATAPAPAKGRKNPGGARAAEAAGAKPKAAAKEAQPPMPEPALASRAPAEPTPAAASDAAGLRLPCQPDLESSAREPPVKPATATTISETTTSEAATPSELELSSEEASSHEGTTPRQASLSGEPSTSPRSPEDAAAAPAICATPPPKARREVVTWGDLGDASLLEAPAAPSCLDAHLGSPEKGASSPAAAAALPLLATMPLSPQRTAPGSPMLPEAALRRAAEALEDSPADATAWCEEDDGDEELAELAEAPASPSSMFSPMSTRSKSARRSHRRRRRHGKGASSEASTASGTASSCLGSPALPSPEASEVDIIGVGREVPPMPVLDAPKSRGADASGPPCRNVVTLSDLGFDLLAPAAGAGAAVAAKAQVQTPSARRSTVPSAPTTPASDAWKRATGNAPGWTPTLPAAPAWSPECRAPAPELIMRTYPAAVPCPWSAAAAGEASQRSPAPSPTAASTAQATAPGGASAASQGDATPLLRSWLHASGLSASGADLAEQLRAVAPEAYED